VRVLDQINRETPAQLDIHLIVDNYASHKHAAVRRWLQRHPRFHIHFTPTSASWLNMVERLFADLTGRRLRRGCFRSVVELKSAIRRYLNDRNAAPKPFVWTKSADTIIRKHERAKGNLILRAEH
jgi:transposase